MEKETPKEEPLKEPETPKSNKELYWILGVMAGLIVLFFAASSIFQSLSKFEYEGLTFREDKFGEIPIYVYTYNSIITPLAISDTKVVNLVLRTDPRENDVPIGGHTNFFPGETVYVAINSTGITQCPYSTLSVATLSSFLASNGFLVKGATVDKTEATENGILYATCDNLPDSAVITIQSGETTQITETREGCHVIEVADCEILPAVEKFMVQSLIDARTRAGL